VRSFLGISNEDLSPLFDLLKGEPNLLSPRQLTPDAYEALQKVVDAISNKQVAWWTPEQPFSLVILNPAKQPHALIFQRDPKAPDPLLIIEWIFLTYQMSKTISTQHEIMALLIIKAWDRLTTLAGVDFSLICLPVTTVYFQ
ncbi:hypothetical protein Nmel_003458, partial [Mimus melanotis]